MPSQCFSVEKGQGREHFGGVSCNVYFQPVRISLKKQKSVMCLLIL